MTRTLIVYLHGIGDNLMLSGVLKEYCRQNPAEQIDLVVLNPGCAAIWQNNPLVNAVTVYPASQPHFWNTVKFYLAHQPKVRRYIRELNADGRYQKVFFPSIQTLPEIIYHVTGTYGRHKIDRICRDLNLPKYLYPYDLHPTEEDADAAKELLARFESKSLAIVHPFSGHTKKRLGSTEIAACLDALQKKGLQTLVVGSAGEKSRLDPAWKTESVFGLSLGVLVEVLKRAEVFAGTDSAVAHLAAFANTPRIVIFSPKLKPERYLPINGQSKITIIRIGTGRKTENLAEFAAALR
jgi:ADP-heptose:LPS heptosyltransferase